MFARWTARPRRLRAADAAAWRALRADAIAHPEVHGDSHDARAGWSDAAFARYLERSEVRGVILRDLLVACLTQEVRGEVMELSDIFVRRAHRRHGHARRLISAAENDARRAGLTALSLGVAEENGAARRAYASLGFREGGHDGRGLATDGRLLTRLRLIKPLAP